MREYAEILKGPIWENAEILKETNLTIHVIFGYLARFRLVIWRIFVWSFGAFSFAVFFVPFNSDTSPKCAKSLCCSGFRMVRCFANTSPDTSPDTSPFWVMGDGCSCSGKRPFGPSGVMMATRCWVLKALVQPNLKFGCCELGISNSHLPLRANFKFTRTRGDGFQVAGVTLGSVTSYISAMGRRRRFPALQQRIRSNVWWGRWWGVW